MAHAWRKFFDLHVSHQSQIAGQALQYIAQLRDIEREGATLNAADGLALRQQRAQPVMQALLPSRRAVVASLDASTQHPLICTDSDIASRWVGRTLTDHQLSERHACALVGLSRDSYRHPVVTSTLNQELLGKIVQTAHERRRWGYPQAVRTDHGPEFISRTFVTWAQKHDIGHLLIQPGSRTQNTYVESFNGTFRDECLDENWFKSLEQAREAIRQWRKDYNEIRPHSSIGGIPPTQFAAENRQLTGDSARTPSNHDTIK